MAPRGAPCCMALAPDPDNRPMQLPQASPCSPIPMQQLGAPAGPMNLSAATSAAVVTAAADVMRHVAEAAALLLSNLLPALSGRPGGVHGHGNGVVGTTTTPAFASCHGGDGIGGRRGPSPALGHPRLDTSSERQGGAAALPPQPDLLFGKGGATCSPQRASARPLTATIRGMRLRRTPLLATAKIRRRCP